MSFIRKLATSLPRDTKWHGNHNENDRQIILHAGHISMIYENGCLRHISAGKSELIRMIYPAVRDKEWLTVNPVIFDEKIKIHSNSFNIEYRAQYNSGPINFIADYTIEGKADNSLLFKLEGAALCSFEKNRIGFCVLHPIEGCRGESCTIIHSDGNSEHSDFPFFISPSQPFNDIKAMIWKPYEFECRLDFYGDIFECEDQRNWTDASYKTYGTPLHIPFPVTLEKGEKVSQIIEFKTNGLFPSDLNNSDPIRISLNHSIAFPVPKIGIGRSTRKEPLTEGEIRLLKRIKFDHYRVDLYLFASEWKVIAEQAVNESFLLEFPLELSLFFDEQSKIQVRDFTDWIIDKNLPIAIVNVYHKTEQSTPAVLADIVLRVLKKEMPLTKISCGTNANFAQLNRKIPAAGFHDCLCYSVHPQEHASDNLSLVENLQAQSYTVESAKHFANGKGIWISPVNIQRRFNANICNYEIPCSGTEFPPQVDSRQMSLFGACWTAGSLKYLCRSGIAGITYFETVGERGIIQGDLPCLWPEKFTSAEGMIFPVYFVFEYINRSGSFHIVSCECSQNLKVELLILTDGKHYRMILVNFTSERQEIIAENLHGTFTMRQLNADTFAEAVSSCDWFEFAEKKAVKLSLPLFIEPFSVSFIDG